MGFPEPVGSLRRRLGADAAAYVAEEWRAGVMADRLLALYRDVAAERYAATAAASSSVARSRA